MKMTRNDRGVLLIEALLAVCVVAAGVVALAVAINGSRRQAHDNEIMLRAADFLAERSLALEVTEGECRDAEIADPVLGAARLTVRRATVEGGVMGPSVRLYEITLTWRSKEREESLRLYKLRAS